jgi:hypothetical protein
MWKTGIWLQAQRTPRADWADQESRVGEGAQTG